MAQIKPAVLYIVFKICAQVGTSSFPAIRLFYCFPEHLNPNTVSRKCVTILSLGPKKCCLSVSTGEVKSGHSAAVCGWSTEVHTWNNVKQNQHSCPSLPLSAQTCCCFLWKVYYLGKSRGREKAVIKYLCEVLQTFEQKW